MVDIRSRIRYCSHLQTGSGHGRIYFRSVPEVDLDDLRVCSQSQVTGSYRFRVIADFVDIGFYYSGVELRFAHELLNITGQSGTLIKISIDDFIQYTTKLPNISNTKYDTK